MTHFSHLSSHPVCESLSHTMGHVSKDKKSRLSNPRDLVAIPLELLEGFIAGGTITEEGVAHYCTGLEIGDNPSITITEHATHQIKLINAYVPNTMKLEIDETRVVEFDNFRDFMDQIRTYVFSN